MTHAPVAVDNAAVAGALEELAELLEVQHANPFRVRAYRTAARTVADLAPGACLTHEGAPALEGMRGIGEDLAGKIAEIARTGTCAQLEALRSAVPPAMLELLRLPGIGASRAIALQQALHITTPEQLRDAALQGRIAGVPGFGPRLAQRVADAVRSRLDKQVRHPLARADRAAAGVLDDLRAIPGVQAALVAGSLRRRRASIGDIDLLASAAAGTPVTRRFVAGPAVRTVLAAGPTRASVVLHDGLQVDLRVVEPASLGAAWLYFTGSKAHNIALRRLAHDAGLKLNEYGLFRGDERVAGATEQAVYAALGLDWIAPELREDHGEVEAARAHALPALVERHQLHGDLRVQLDAAHGGPGLEAMARAARAAGLAWIAVVDRVGAAPGDGLLREHAQAIAAWNAAHRQLHVFHALEAEILADGDLALPQPTPVQPDWIVGVVRQPLGLARDAQTARLLRALAHPLLAVLARPQGRADDRQSGWDVDLQQLAQRARERGCCFELDAARLDVDEAGCRLARDAGVHVAIGSGATAPEGYARLDGAVDEARRGWLGVQDVLNTRTASQLPASMRQAQGGR